jgi:hypothetical protein
MRIVPFDWRKSMAQSGPLALSLLAENEAAHSSEGGRIAMTVI